MKVETFAYQHSSGWSRELPKSLDSTQTLVLFFGAPSFGRTVGPMNDLVQAFPNSQVIGCSTAGEILDTSIHDETLSVAVARFERSSISSASVDIQSAKNSCQAGVELAQSLMAPDLRAITLLSDGIAVNGSELVRGINSVVPTDVVVTGGLAGDGERFESTWVFCDGMPRNGVIAAIAYYGDAIRVGHGSKGGWDMFGPERVITKSEDNVLFELDGKPALSIYKRYLGDRAAGLPATALLFPLAIRNPEDSEKLLVRTVLAVDEDKQTMTFAGDVPENQVAQLMRANFDRIIDGASQAAVSVSDTQGEALSEVLTIAISCVGRRLILGERAEEEVEATLEALPQGAKQVGFYSYGEISPYGTGSCDLHNQTMTLTTVGEA